MIFVERPPEPSGFAEEAAKGLLQAEQFFALARERRRGRSFDFGRSHSKLLKLSQQPLSRMFLGKCAYCETPAMASGDASVDFYRPRNGVAEISGGYLGDPALGLARMLWELRCKETVSHLGHYVELATWLTSYREPFESPIMRALGPELPLHLLQCFGRLCFPMVRTPRQLKDLRWALRRLGVQLRAADGSGSTPSEYRFRLIDRRPESQRSDTGQVDVDVLRVTQGGRPPNAVQVS